jgi:uncharacterized protein (TIGR04255 family)
MPQKLEEAAATEIESLRSGLRVESDDKLRVGIFLQDRFSFNRLAPYGDWEQFKSEAYKLWAFYRDRN